MRKTSIATVSLSGPLDEKLRAIAAAGFDAVEIFEADFVNFDGTPRDVRRMAEDLGLEIITFQPFRDFEGMPEPQRSRNFERAKRKFALMQDLGTDLMLVCSNISPLALGGIVRAADDFRALGEIAEPMGIRVGFEALAWGIDIALFVLIYRVLPNTTVKWRAALCGGLIIGFLWEIFKKGFAIYLAHFGAYNKIYGAFGGLVLLVTWILYSCMTLLGGAILCKMYQEHTEEGGVAQKAS